MLDRLQEFFEANRKKLAAEHHGQYVVIHDNEIVGFYDDELEAYEEAKLKYGAGSFLLQHCIRLEEETKAVFHSRVG